MKTTFVSCLFTLLLTGSYLNLKSQPLLKTNYAKMCTASNGEWNDWPDDWAPLTPKFRFTQIDALALEFRVGVTLVGFTVNSKFVYVGYDSENNWFKYKDEESSDVICIEGVKMSYLANTGWPNWDVKIYIWSKSNGIAMAFD